MYEKKRSSFRNIHTLFPSLLAKLCKQNNLKHFIHLSALGIENAKDSLYARSKLKGEISIKKNIREANIFKNNALSKIKI